MAHEISPIKDANGNLVGLELTVQEDDGTNRSVRFEVNTDGTLTVEGVAPDGTSKRGTIDPTAGSTSLGV